MARAIPRKVYANSGEYLTGGRRQPKEKLDPAFVCFMDERGIDIHNERPRPIDWVPEEWDDFDVIVSLEGPVGSYLTEVPFRSVVLEWELPPPPEAGTAEDEVRARFEKTYRELAHRVRELMEMLQGDDAS